MEIRGSSSDSSAGIVDVRFMEGYKWRVQQALKQKLIRGEKAKERNGVQDRLEEIFDGSYSTTTES